VSSDIGESVSSMRIDLAGAYERSDVRHWWRTARLDRSRGRISITDEWDLDETDDAQPTVVHLLLAGDVELADDQAIVTTLCGGHRAVLRWSPLSLRTNVITLDLHDPMLSHVWGNSLTRLALDVGVAPSGSLTVYLEVHE
jgi:hypothetical protein